ncbi:hypothetical protein [Paenibacillus lemnae]|uniref:Nucleotidyltransferase domain-containing protein n=1 Tax=Paenibacillus lemnae TaxID=1330551 RepID=A0A848M4W4_PAELE|nr:hypothetical protein [Paenibacillus lemnae]NMO95270.1 hypothetical protein [Paenibacillus lemnae]
MTVESLLLQRLNQIGESLERKEEALALFGLGSVGVETGRIDEFSDLDFFVIAAPGRKQSLIDRLDWLEDICPLAYQFKNCELGYKFLYEDGIYGEFAVFEPAELDSALYTGGRMVWKRPDVLNDDIAAGKMPLPAIRAVSLDHVVGEAVTNLYVGLGRYLRGEKMSAFKFIQGYPIDGLMSVLHILKPEINYFPDPFGNERRLESRFPGFSEVIGNMLQGYDKTPESALHLLEFLESIYPVNPRMSQEIRKLAERCLSKTWGREGM